MTNVAIALKCKYKHVLSEKKKSGRVCSSDLFQGQPRIQRNPVSKNKRQKTRNKTMKDSPLSRARMPKAGSSKV